MVKMLSTVKQRYAKMLRDIKSDPYNHKIILPVFFLLIVLPFIFIFLPAVFMLFWLVFAFPKFFLVLNILCLLFFFIALLIGCFNKAIRLISWKTSLWIAIIFGSFWIASFMSGGACAFAAHLGIRMVSSEVRFPMGYITSIDIDSKGQVYCADRSHCRLQIFSDDGEFLRGWFVPISCGGIYISIINNNSLSVDDIDDKKSHIYDSSGHLLAVKRDQVYPKVDPSNKLRVSDDSGNIYKVTKTLYSWQISKISKNEESILISDPFVLSIFAMPFPAFGLVLFSIILIGFAHSLVVKAKRFCYLDLPMVSKISEPEKKVVQQDKIGKVKCLCEKINILEGMSAHDYAKDHLKAINVIDGGRQIEYLCPYTGKLWLMDFTQETNANQENYSRLRPIPKKD